MRWARAGRAGGGLGAGARCSLGGPGREEAVSSRAIIPVVPQARQPAARMSYMLPHLHNGWQVDQAILSEEDRVVVIRFGHDWDPTCMKMDEVLYSIAEKVNRSCLLVLSSVFPVDCLSLGFCCYPSRKAVWCHFHECLLKTALMFAVFWGVKRASQMFGSRGCCLSITRR